MRSWSDNGLVRFLLKYFATYSETETGSKKALADISAMPQFNDGI